MPSGSPPTTGDLRRAQGYLPGRPGGSCHTGPELWPTARGSWGPPGKLGGTLGRRGCAWTGPASATSHRRHVPHPALRGTCRGVAGSPQFTREGSSPQGLNQRL